MGEKLAIVSPKVQTTRHRIKAILTEKDYQIIFSDTPGIIQPQYKLHEKMMQSVKNALEDADVAILLVDVNDNWEENDTLFSGLKLKVPAIVAINKVDKADAAKVQEAINFFEQKDYAKKVIAISAWKGVAYETFFKPILEFLPEGAPFYDDSESISDLPEKFFVSELIREKIYELTQDEIPYHTTVLIREFKEKLTLTKIVADIIVQRESQKMILIGEKGKMIKQIGTLARADIEAFLDRKVFLELFVKVRPKWRDNDMQLKEYGYGI
ncbi:GTPase Era [Mycovorax composti]|jgi:GTP-binding protein Era